MAKRGREDRGLSARTSLSTTIASSLMVAVSIETFFVIGLMSFIQLYEDASVSDVIGASILTCPRIATGFSLRLSSTLNNQIRVFAQHITVTFSFIFKANDNLLGISLSAKKSDQKKGQPVSVQVAQNVPTMVFKKFFFFKLV